METVYMKISKTVGKEEIEKRIKGFEKKYKTDFRRFKNKMKGIEDTDENEQIIEDYDDWAGYRRTLKVIERTGKSPLQEEYFKLIPESKFGEIDDIFTKERIRVLKFLNKRQVGSIAELSKLLKRDRSSVVQDLEVLDKEGIITFERKGRVAAPVTKCSAITLIF
jgi:predicted transcriptional regulator